MDDDLWNQAKERAHEEGVALNYVAEVFLAGYAQGQINLPTVNLTFEQGK